MNENIWVFYLKDERGWKALTGLWSHDKKNTHKRQNKSKKKTQKTSRQIKKNKTKRNKGLSQEQEKIRVWYFLSFAPSLIIIWDWWDFGDRG